MSRMTIREIEMWVLNDEALYWAWKATRLSMRTYIRTRRDELEAAIRSRLGRQPA